MKEGFEIICRRGAVANGPAEAARAAAALLQRGNATDAAAAACLACAVMEPQAVDLGGYVLAAVVLDGATGDVWSLDANTVAPAAARSRNSTRPVARSSTALYSRFSKRTATANCRFHRLSVTLDGQRNSPKGMSTHYVQKGDCIRSLAKKFGLLPDKIWQHPNNEQFRNQRQDPCVLLKGDQLFIPDKELREDPASTDQKHNYHLNVVKTKLRVRLFDEEDAIANTPCTLTVAGVSYQGSTDDSGLFEHLIPADAATALLLVEDTFSIELRLGELDPADSETGLQQRLFNMGYFAGPVTGQIDDDTKTAILRWQQDYKLGTTRKIDSQTQASLKTEYGC